VRSRTLHAALVAFVEEAAGYLAAQHAAGAELPFDVVEVSRRRGRAATLYCYRPLTSEFIGQRRDELRTLATFAPAVRALSELEGLDRYLRARGHGRVAPERRHRAEVALAAFLADVFREATDFELSSERLERAYELLESAVFAGQRQTVAVAVVHGLALESPELALGEGLSLVRSEALADPPPSAAGAPDRGDCPPLLAVLSLPAPPGDRQVCEEAAARLALLVRALRLFGETWVGAEPIGWLRVDEGDWQPLALPCGGPSRGTLAVLPDGEDELRAFCNLVIRRAPRSHELAWALSRFEMGYQRPSLVEALTDHVLALRSLLEPEGPASGHLSGRVAALCAVPEERAETAERLRYATQLEYAAATGASVGEEDVAELAFELSAHLRALLRDVLCGHLDSDLRRLADGIILAPAGSQELAETDGAVAEEEPVHEETAPAEDGPEHAPAPGEEHPTGELSEVPDGVDAVTAPVPGVAEDELDPELVGLL